MRSPELKAMIEQRAGDAVTLRFSERRPHSREGGATTLPRDAEKAERKSAVAHQPSKADEGVRPLLTRHALDWIATDGLDGADPFHADPPVRPGEPSLVRR